jgi:hypothetical protein
MDHAGDCLICSREWNAAMRLSNFGADLASTAQYFCQATNTDEKKESPPIGFALEADNPGDVGLVPRETSPRDINANNFIRPQRFSCKGSDTDPAAYSAYRYDGGRTFSFKLDEAMAITVEDDKINEIAIDTWFMPRYTKHK